jgi:glycosyltransferase involved in cell wall biosynthesis
VVVPCEWNAKSFKDCGVHRPIKVIPLGYSPDIFHFTPMQEREKVIFGCAGRTGHGPARKGMQRTIDLFLETFKGVENVELHVKLHPDCQIKEVKDKRVKVIKEHLQWHQLRAWLANLDVFVSLATAEGFGLLQLQAMALGRPVMAAIYSGMAKYLAEDNCFSIPFTEKSVPELGGGMVSETTDAAAKAAFLQAYLCDSSIRSMLGQKANESAIRFPWGQTVHELHKLMLEVGAI